MHNDENKTNGLAEFFINNSAKIGTVALPLAAFTGALLGGVTIGGALGLAIGVGIVAECITATASLLSAYDRSGEPKDFSSELRDAYQSAGFVKSAIAPILFLATCFFGGMQTYGENNPTPKQTAAIEAPVTKVPANRLG
jgi:hypothetical protein